MKNIAKISDFTLKLADEAAQITQKYFRNKSIGSNSKADLSLVTVADTEIEKRLSDLINHEFPNHVVYGEETGGTISPDKPTWVIDPIDGTSSFVSGRPIFGTMIAYLENGIPLVGIISQPILGENWIGVAGEKTKLNNAPVESSSNELLRESIIATTSTFLFPDDDFAAFDHVRKSSRQTVQGGDCYSYAMLASGFVGVVMESGLKPHDFLPLIPIIEGAGGIITDWQGEQLTYQSRGHVLATANKSLHKEVLAIICSPIIDI